MNTNKLKVYANVTKDFLKENWPKIAVAVGVGSGAAAVGFAIKQTLTVNEVIDDHAERVKEVKLWGVDNASISDREYNYAITKEYVKTAGYLAKHYKWPIALELLSIGLVCGGFNAEEKKYFRASATAAAFYAELTSLQNRIEAKYGSEALYELNNDISEETIETVDENGKKKKEKIKVANNDTPGAFSFFLGKDYYKYWNENWSDIQNITDMKNRLSDALRVCSKDIYTNGYVWFDKIADRVGIEVTDMHRKAAVMYDLENFDEKHQLHPDRNVVIHDAHILTGGEKVILVEIKGVVPEFKISQFDKDLFFKDKSEYKDRLAMKN